jgi:DNA-binding HxlR family transcriptional regulator
MGKKIERANSKKTKKHSRFCPRFHHAVELIGRRWSGAILNAMLPGPQGFNELLATVPRLSDRLLTERLRELESEGLVRRSVIPGPPVRVSYEMTEAGKDLEPVIRALGKWADRWVTLETDRKV